MILFCSDTATQRAPKGGGENQIESPALREYYEQLRGIVSGPLFTMDRWRNIWAFNFGSKRRYRGSFEAVEPLPAHWRRSAATRLGASNDPGL